jgi:RNA polymerase sigma factor (sigma-70 family)
LIETNMEYARNIANKMSRKFSNAVIDADDMEQLAYSGLMQAAERFDVSLYDGRGTPEEFFRKWASTRIIGSIQDECRRMSFERRRGAEKEINFTILSLDYAGEWEDGNPWLKELGFTQDEDLLIDFQTAMDTLSERQKRVVLGMVMGETYKEIGGELGVSESRVAQIVTQTRDILMEHLDV